MNLLNSTTSSAEKYLNEGNLSRLSFLDIMEAIVFNRINKKRRDCHEW